MADEHVVYLGRTIPKKGFRVFIYDENNEQLLVESWDEYEMYIESGEWFPTKREMSEKKQHKNHDKGKK